MFAKQQGGARTMREEFKILCKDARELPTVARIRMLVSPDQDLTIEFPDLNQNRQLVDLHRQTVQRLRRALPGYTVNENCSVKAGRLSLTIQLIDEGRELLDQANLIMTALRRYQRQSRQLMTFLAHQLQVEPLEINDSNFILRFRGRKALEGKLTFTNGDKGSRNPLRLPFLSGHSEQAKSKSFWRYHLFADRCRFIQRPSGQVIETCIGYIDDFGVFDQACLSQYLRTTPGMETVALLLSENCLGIRAVLEMFVEHHYLLPIQTPARDIHYFSLRNACGLQ